MKCHNCGVEMDVHKENGCNEFMLDVPDYGSAWRELAGWLQEAKDDGGDIKAEDLLLYMRELTRASRNRKGHSLKLNVTAQAIGEGIQAHFSLYQSHSYDCADMDKFISMWTRVIQEAKPQGVNACKAFRRVLVMGERDW